MTKTKQGYLWISGICSLGLLGALGVPPMQAQTEMVLHSFAAPAGAHPFAGVTRDSAGNLYGTTLTGGPAKAGVVYKLDRSRHYTMLHSFTGRVNGGKPQSSPTLGSAGNLYGTTPKGGHGSGVLYKLDAAGNYSVMSWFKNENHGDQPYACVIVDSAGNLYGTTYFGGTDYGVVFKVDTVGRETVLYGFTGGADGRYPYAGVILDSAGSLYGTTYNGGSAGLGVVYKLGIRPATRRCSTASRAVPTGATHTLA
jgi:uncharacterized repeat protein (TIGR03803 family)